HIPSLQHLDLSWCKNITDAGLIQLAQHIPSLQHLNLFRCHNITDAGLTALKQQGVVIEN
ncbi:MAG: leucine-rich repeat domain-containing protein, partial [Leptonema sp. (in: bacteria)]